MFSPFLIYQRSCANSFSFPSGLDLFSCNLSHFMLLQQSLYLTQTLQMNWSASTLLFPKALPLSLSLFGAGFINDSPLGSHRTYSIVYRSCSLRAYAKRACSSLSKPWTSFSSLSSSQLVKSTLLCFPQIYWVLLLSYFFSFLYVGPLHASLWQLSLLHHIKWLSCFCLPAHYLLSLLFRQSTPTIPLPAITALIANKSSLYSMADLAALPFCLTLSLIKNRDLWTSNARGMIVLVQPEPAKLPFTRSLIQEMLDWINSVWPGEGKGDHCNTQISKLCTGYWEAGRDWDGQVGTCPSHIQYTLDMRRVSCTKPNPC